MLSKRRSVRASAVRPSAAASSGTIIVKVGRNGKEYTLHTELLKQHSGYFRGALSHDWKETVDGIIPLTDVETDLFDMFVDWIYQGTISTPFDKTGPLIKVKMRHQCYFLADRLLAVGMKDALMDDIFRLYEQTGYGFCPSGSEITDVFAKLTEMDPLVKLYVDIWHTTGGPEQGETPIINDMKNLPKEFLVLLAVRSWVTSRNQMPGVYLNRNDYNQRVSLDEPGNNDLLVLESSSSRSSSSEYASSEYSIE
ncbi:BTB domain containing protein [Pyrenophora tritici-repentis]|uniref:BTB domain containing protein n=1 Tax=Pyrenophora tritici-repentis TaxID=45151 RepID=A0A2W1DD08_9PLEO|nr:BTB domain-containing protein [Pyrenophora tritici-repentis]KAF7448269.1 BTB domain containing protein [Pyrenophora tritici-repentis]KAF7571988.1 BTB domain containing protein [Pyrenophora tritici-repentis]KAG9384830.1 BTB domain containing protein [Pyrenophora tritici-repentis]KAI0579977.1 BTB domain-containing protein [Pyrenophora tritici-repentis]